MEKTKRKVKLATSLIAMAITFIMMCFGVFAATNVTYSGSGAITFEGTADIAMTIEGEYAYNGVKQEALQFTDGKGALATTASWSASEAQGQEHTSEVQVPNLTFNAATDTYTFTFTITNNLTATAINADVSGAVASDKYTSVTVYKVGADGSTTKLTEDEPQSIAAGETLTVQIAFALNATENALYEEGVSTTYDITLSFAR